MNVLTPRGAAVALQTPPRTPQAAVALQTPPAPQESDGAKIARGLIKNVNSLINLATQIGDNARHYRGDHDAAASREARLNLFVNTLEKLAPPLRKDILNHELERFLETIKTLVEERNKIDSLNKKLSKLCAFMPELISAHQILLSINNELVQVNDFEALTNLGNFGEQLNLFDQLIDSLATTLGYQEDPQEMRNLTILTILTILNIEEKFDLLSEKILFIKDEQSPHQQQMPL